MTAVALPVPYLRPTSLSATALTTAGSCMARYKAENIDRARSIQNVAASIGTSVHGGLETFVRSTKMEGHTELDNLDYLIECYQVSYVQTFGSADFSGEEYNDGLDLTKKWYERTTWDGITVLSVESKENFPLVSKDHDYSIPFNYIFDRLDRIGPESDGVYRIVDYKTNRARLNPNDLDLKLQARIYALVAQMKYPDAKKIWVEFDLLRHDSVGRVFSKDQNIATWRFLKSEFIRILNTPEDECYETLNPECGFCVRKTTCTALLKNIASGGIFSFGDVSEVVNQRAVLQWQLKAIEKAIDELDTQIVMEAKKRDVIEFETDMARIGFKVRRVRSVPPEMVKLVIGDDLFNDYGGLKLTMAQFDLLMKDPEVTPEKKAQLKGLVSYTSGNETIEVTARTGLGAD